jgi:hypothetical protein
MHIQDKRACMCIHQPKIHQLISYKLNICMCAAPFAEARHAAWHGTYAVGPYIASMVAVRRPKQWRGTIVCRVLETGAAKKNSLVKYFCQKFII